MNTKMETPKVLRSDLVPSSDELSFSTITENKSLSEKRGVSDGDGKVGFC